MNNVIDVDFKRKQDEEQETVDFEDEIAQDTERFLEGVTAHNYADAFLVVVTQMQTNRIAARQDYEVLQDKCNELSAELTVLKDHWFFRLRDWVLSIRAK